MLVDTRTLADLLEQVRGLVRMAAARIGGNSHDREDAASEIELHLIEKVVPAFDPARASWPALASIACSNKARDIARRRARHNRNVGTQQLPDDLPAADTDLSVERLIDEIRENPAAFFPRMRPAVLAAAFDPAGPAATSLPSSVVHQARHRVAERLRQLV